MPVPLARERHYLSPTAALIIPCVPGPPCCSTLWILAARPFAQEPSGLEQVSKAQKGTYSETCIQLEGLPCQSPSRGKGTT